MNNNYEVRGDEVWIQLWRKGESMWTVIDLADLNLVIQARGAWQPNPARAPKGKFYVQTKGWNTLKQSDGTILMHRLIFGFPKYEVHHKDNDGLNNRRSNFDHLTHVENVREHWPERDWTTYDAKRKLADEYREERRIAREVQAEFELTRQQLWFIRRDATCKSPAALAYRERTEASGVRTLEGLKGMVPRDGTFGKFGIGISSDRYGRLPW